MDSKSKIDLNRICGVVSEFIPDTDIEVIGTNEGEYNTVYILSSSIARYALRLKKKPISIDLRNIAYEIEFMEQLRKSQKSIHVAHNIPTKGGELLFENDEAFYNLQTLVPGLQRYSMWYEASSLSSDDVHQLFTTLAALHDAYRTIRIEPVKRFDLFAFLDDFSTSLNATPLPEGSFKREVLESRDFICRRITELSQTFRIASFEALPEFPTHFDMNVCNVLWDKNRITSLVDFDWVRHSTLEFEFCRTASLNCSTYIKGSPEKSGFDPERLRVAWSSYNATSKHPFKNPELITQLLDVSSLFLSHWAYTTYVEQLSREEYLLWFFLSGVDRLRHPERSELA